MGYNKKSEPQNILVVKNRALGDAVIGLSALKYLKNYFKSSKITYAVPEWTSALFANVQIDAHEVYPLKLQKLSDFIAFFFWLRKNKFDLIIELHQRGRSGKFLKFYSLLTYTKYIFHNHNLTKRAPAIERDLKPCFEVVKKLYPEATFPNYLDYEPRLEILKEVQSKSHIIFGIVATRKTKMWPLKYYKFLSDMILKKNPQMEITIPLSNSPSDKLLEEEFQKINPDRRVNFLKVSLSELPYYLKSAKFYIGNDTGLKHICVALGIPTYTFFGPEEPYEWHPYSTEKHQYFFREKLSCRIKEAHYCGLSTCETMICLNQFIPAEIFTKLLS